MTGKKVSEASSRLFKHFSISPDLKNKYRPTRILGEGGMGVVFLADQIELDRQVAIKCIRTDTFSGEDGLKRFVREARVLASLEHHGIVRIFDVDKLDDVLFIVSEFIDGCTLKQKIRQTPFRLNAAVRLIRDVASTIDFVHGRSIIHRDIKSENILLPKEGGIKVIDFGLARDYSDEASQSITKTGEFLGTAEYMAPEIILAQQVNALCDVYALGCLFYELLTGHFPYTGSPMEILNQHMKIPFPKVATSCSGCPPQVDEIIQRATTKDPALRTESAAVFVSELTAFLESPNPVSSGGSPLLGARKPAAPDKRRPVKRQVGNRQSREGGNQPTAMLDRNAVAKAAKATKALPSIGKLSSKKQAASRASLPTRELSSVMPSNAGKSVVFASSVAGGSTIVGMVKKARKRQLFGLVVMGLTLLSVTFYIASDGFFLRGGTVAEVDKDGALAAKNTAAVSKDQVPSDNRVLATDREQFILLKELAADVLKEDSLVPLFDNIRIECFKGHKKIDVSDAHNKVKQILSGDPLIVELKKMMPRVPFLLRSSDLTVDEKISLCNALYPLISFDQLFLLLGKDLFFNVKNILSPFVKVVEKGGEEQFSHNEYLFDEDIRLLSVKMAFKPLAPFSDEEARVLSVKGDSGGEIVSHNITHLRGGIFAAWGINEAKIVFTPPNFSLPEAVLETGHVTFGIVRRQFAAVYRFKITINGSFSFYITDTLPESEKIRFKYALSQTTVQTKTWYKLPSSVFRKTGNNVTIVAESLWPEFSDAALYPVEKEGLDYSSNDEDLKASRQYLFVPILFGVVIKDANKP